MDTIVQCRYCCVFRIGNYVDIIKDLNLSGYEQTIYNITREIYIQLEVEIYNITILGTSYYYCYLDDMKLSMFRMYINKYRGKGIIILFGTYIYYEPLQSVILGGHDIIQMNLILSAIGKLNIFSINIPPVRRMHLERGQLQEYISYCN